MSITARLRRAPGRIVTGTFILHSGVVKLRGDDATATTVHGVASGAYPRFAKVEPKLFLKSLGAGEVALGAALLLPVVPTVLAGAGLAAFTGGLLGIYWRTPGMHKQGSPLPTKQGIPLAKDIWMGGIAASLILDGLTSPVHDARLEQTAKVRGAARSARGGARRAVRQAQRRAAKAVH